MSNYEDLEYLAEYLPEEGESVIVTRRSGNLVCEPYQEPISDSQVGVISREFYGRLVAMNAKLRQFWTRPLALSALLIYLVCIGVQQWFQLGWSSWLIYGGICVAILMGTSLLVHFRQKLFLRNQISPQLNRHMAEHHLDKYTLV
ncbi:MAG: hypothetical protein KDA78_18320, partial [Planctomycetaceae bacterium]|nr:hypothetical protein [Planctomycetaceae bacterium]